MEFNGENFAGQTILTDGNVYTNCDFNDANLEFGGGAMPSFSGCSFGTATFVFVDGAERTINFLRGMGGMGKAGSDLVRKLLSLPF